MKSAKLLPLTLLLPAGAALALGPQPPDQVDVFYSGLLKPNIELLLDASGSMNGGSNVAVCTWYQTSGPLAPVSASNMNKKHHQLRASLIGCSSASDGILDKWSSKVNFAVRIFDAGSALLAPFGASKATMEAQVAGFGLGGGTSMTLGLRQAGVDFGVFADPAPQCRPNMVLLLSDGNPNSAGGTFDYACNPPGPATVVSYGPGEPWCGAAYLAGSTASSSGSAGCSPDIPVAYSDMICGLSGNQNISVYTIGFGKSGSFSPSNLQRIALLGKGQYYYASNVSSLDAALDAIITSFSSQPQVAFNAATVQLDGVFTGKEAFAPSFKPSSQGLWVGNIKKSCLVPPVKTNGDFDNTVTDCYYRADPTDFKKLAPNPAPTDQFALTTALDASVGGVGKLLRDRLSTVPGGTVPQSPFFPRSLLTYRPGTAALVSLRDANVKADDLYLHGIERIKAINRLHGYSFDADLTDSDGYDEDVSGLDPDDTDPLTVGTWPLGESMNAQPLHLDYDGGGRYLVMPANDGMLHAFNAATGAETSALVPGELLAPHPATNFSLRDLFASVNDNVRHPYLLDGQPRLFHRDLDADGRIDPADTAHLIVGLGRAGAGYYLLPMRTFSGTFSAANNGVRRLLRTPGTHYADLGDTWAAPWVGQMKVGAATRNVAIFGSGHERFFDDPAAWTPSAFPGEWSISPPLNISCTAIAASSSIAASFCGSPVLTGSTDFVPLDLAIGPFTLPGAIAYRARFTSFDVDPADAVLVQAGEGSTAEVLRGTLGASYVTQWVYDDQLLINVTTDGNVSGNAGMVLDSVDYRVANQGPARLRSPSIYVVDLDAWAAEPAFAATNGHGSMLLRFTASCAPFGASATCIDATVVPDLQHMRCPISAEVSVLEAGGRAERVYVGDECGQIWRLSPGAGGVWNVRRIFHANSDAGFPASWPASVGAPSNQIRRIQRKIDLVQSRCTGRNTIGLYFGTGNVQRPSATDDVTARGDILGVLWDDGTLDVNTDMNDLQDVSITNSVSAPVLAAGGKKGWFFQLRAGERMLRDPLVFANVAYYKTFRPVTSATECTPGAGEDSVYSVQSCTVEAYNDGNSNGTKEFGERLASFAIGDIGASPTLVATRDTAVVVAEKGSISNRKATDFRRAYFLNWRLK